MSPSRLRAATSKHAVGQQVYAVIESCTSPETLWAKVESGHWDWLGVEERQGRATFLLGRPRIARSGLSASGTAIHGSAQTGQHGIEVRQPSPHPLAPSSSWYATEAEAQAAFAGVIRDLETGEGSGRYKVSLVQHGRITRNEFVVRRLPNRL